MELIGTKEINTQKVKNGGKILTTTFCKDTRRRRERRTKFRKSVPLDDLRVFSASSAQHVEPPRSTTLLLLSMSSVEKLDPSRGFATHWPQPPSAKAVSTKFLATE